MPSLIGMNLSDVVYLLENHGLKVSLTDMVQLLISQ